jgi:hypothetical protein
MFQPVYPSSVIEQPPSITSVISSLSELIGDKWTSIAARLGYDYTRIFAQMPTDGANRTAARQATLGIMHVINAGSTVYD